MCCNEIADICLFLLLMTVSRIAYVFFSYIILTKQHVTARGQCDTVKIRRLKTVRESSYYNVQKINRCDSVLIEINFLPNETRLRTQVDNTVNNVQDFVPNDFS